MSTHAARSAVAVCFYMGTSVALVFFNKYALSHSFQDPLLLTWWQMVVSWPLLAGMRRCSGAALVERFELRACLSVLPMTVVYSSMVVTSNVCLQYVHASSYQIARSMHLVFSVGLTRALTGSRPPARQLVACGVITAGYVLGCATNVHFSPAGLLFGCLSSFLNAANAVLVKHTLPAVGFDSWRLQEYNTLLAIVVLLGPVLHSSSAGLGALGGGVWLIVLIGGGLGFLLSLATSLSVKHTSPLGHMVAGTVKGAAQSLIAPLVFGNATSPREQVGTLVCLAGSAWFTWLRMQPSESAGKQHRE